MTRIIPMIASLSLSFMAVADEGMWTFDNFPADTIAEKYGVDIDDGWLRQTRLATTRLENGCTGSFASATGLVLTNNHCTWGCIRNLSTAERNLSDTGFNARTQAEELRCPGQQISVLVNFEEVSDEVSLATAGMDEAAANEARMGELELPRAGGRS